MSFDPTPYMLELRGKSYLPVQARVAWFREDCPMAEGWGIVTERVAGGYEAGFATYRATILDPQERHLATATKTEDKAGFADFEEKAETGAIGRALGLCGFGTLFALELEEGERIADSPVERAQDAPQRAQPVKAPPPAPPAPPEPSPTASRATIAAKYADWLERAAHLGALQQFPELFRHLMAFDALHGEPQVLLDACARLKSMVADLEAIAAKDAEDAHAHLDLAMDVAARGEE